MAIISVLAAGLLWRARHCAVAGVVLVAAAGAGLLVEGFKHLYLRSRPPLSDRLVTESSFALPSGHALGSVVVLGVLAAAAVVLVRRRGARIAAVALAAAGSGGIGASRAPDRAARQRTFLEGATMVLTFLQRIGEHLGGWFYLIAGALTFAEAAAMIGVVFPGETALLVAGFAANRGWIGLWPMIAVAVTAAVAGDSVGYEAGRVLGPWLRRSRLGRRIGASRWDTAERFLSRHGGKAVLLGRCTAILRALTPGMAGMARMPYLRTFLPWNLAGGLLWGAGCVLLGYAFSASLTVVGHYLTYGPLVLVAAALGALIVLHLRRRRRRLAPASDEPARLETASP